MVDVYIVTSIFLLTVAIPSFRRMYFGESRNLGRGQAITKRLAFFDFIRGIAILGVMGMHIVYFFEKYGDGTNRSLLIFLNNILRFSIPLFFICSGILLKPITRFSEMGSYFSKKIKRLFIPYLLISMLILSAYNLSWKEVFYYFFTGNTSVPYYFIIVLFQLYIIYPLLSLIMNRVVFFFAFLASLAGLLFPEFNAVGGFPLFLRFLFFFVYGMYMRNYYLEYKKDKKEVGYWIPVVLVYLVLATIIDEFVYNSRLFYGIAVFNLLFYFREKIYGGSASEFISGIGRISLWIFLTHFSVFHLVYKISAAYLSGFWLPFISTTLFGSAISILLAHFIKEFYDGFFKYVIKKL